MDKKGTKILLLGNNWKGTKRPQAYFIISGIRNIIGQEGTFVEKRKTLLLGMIEKEQKGLKLKLEGTLLGKIGTLMDEKEQNSFKEWLKRNKMVARLKLHKNMFTE